MGYRPARSKLQRFGKPAGAFFLLLLTPRITQWAQGTFASGAPRPTTTFISQEQAQVVKLLQAGAQLTQAEQKILQSWLGPGIKA